MAERYFLIPCKIERGGFTTERLFTIDLPNGPEAFAGYYEHFLNADKQPLDVNAPPPGQKIDGFAKCRVLRVDGDEVVIDIPSSDAVVVRKTELESAPA